MPTATAIGFLTAPQNSTPTTSSLVYTRKVSLVTAAWSATAIASSAAAITVADGMSRPTSSAWLGPERAAAGDPVSSSMTCVGRFSVPSS